MFDPARARGFRLSSSLSEGVTGSSSTVGKTFEAVGMGDKREVRNLSIAVFHIKFSNDFLAVVLKWEKL